MAFQLAGFKSNGLRIEGATRQQVKQLATFYINMLATDTALDIANDTTGSLGTFWTAVTTDATYGALGLSALTKIQQIIGNVQSLNEVNAQALLDRTAVTGPATLILTSTAVSNATSATATIAGILATDTVGSVTQSTANSGAIVPIAFGTPTGTGSNGTLPLTYASAPGTGGQVTVMVQRAAANLTGSTVPTGSYTYSTSGHLPLITFSSGNAPTLLVLELAWILHDNLEAVVTDLGVAF